ncbi:MAG: TraU family protein [Blastocatellia bacterium]
MNGTRIPAVVLVLALSPATLPPAAARGIPSDCLRFLPVGICVWLTCAGPFCSLDTSVKYGHFNPDLLVTVNNPQGDNRAEDAHRSDTHTRNHQNLIYREVHALGHPLAGQIYCPSQASALNPYFLSELDSLGWRWGIPDMLSPPSFVPGLREIGHWPLNTWGAVYPRTGWTIQADDPKAAAVVAHRAGDIITRSGEPHVYQALTGPATGGNKLTWPPLLSLTENTNRGGDWQLEPDAGQQNNQQNSKLPSCEVFGEFDPLRSRGGGKVSSDGDYLFTLWRPYTCCEIEGASLVFTADFIAYPPPSP